MSEDLTKNGKPWGWFDPQGKPIATGDDWHRWECPRREWVPVGYEHYITGEWIDEGFAPQNCPTKIDGPKRECCTRCGNVFIYP